MSCEWVTLVKDCSRAFSGSSSATGFLRPVQPLAPWGFSVHGETRRGTATVLLPYAMPVSLRVALLRVRRARFAVVTRAVSLGWWEPRSFERRPRVCSFLTMGGVFFFLFFFFFPLLWSSRVLTRGSRQGCASRVHLLFCAHSIKAFAFLAPRASVLCFFPWFF